MTNVAPHSIDTADCGDVQYPGTPEVGSDEPQSPTPRPNRRQQLTLKAWAQASVAGVAGYGAALAVAIVLVLVLNQWAASIVTEEWALSTQFPWSFPIHLVSLAVFGAMNIKMVEGSGTAVAIESETNTILVLLPLTVTLGLVIYLCTRVLAKRYSATTRQTLMLATVTGISLALLVSLAAYLFPARSPESTISVTETTTSAGIGAFLGAFGVAFTVSWATWLAYSGIWSTWSRKFKLLAHNAIRVAGVHFAFLTVVCGVVGLAAVPFVGLPETAADIGRGPSSSANIGTASMANFGAYAAVLGTLGTIDSTYTTSLVKAADVIFEPEATVTVMEGANDDVRVSPPSETEVTIITGASTETLSVSLFSDSGPDTLLGSNSGLNYIILGIAILAALGAALLLAARRRESRPSLLSLLGTVAIYSIIGLAFQIMLRFSTSARRAERGIDWETTASFAPAMWTFLVFGALGIAIECMARFVFPALVRRMSPRMLARVQWISGADISFADAELADAELADAELADAELAETGSPDGTAVEVPEGATEAVAMNPPRAGHLGDPLHSDPSAVLDYRTPESDLDQYRPQSS